MVPWRDRLRHRSASRRPDFEQIPPEELYARNRQVENNRRISRSVSPEEDIHAEKSRSSKRRSSEQPPSRAEMYQAIQASRELAEARTLNKVQEKMVFVHAFLERIAEKARDEEKAKKSNNWVDMALTIFLVVVVTLWFWANAKLSDYSLGQFRLYFV